jgi:hypothetical protein
MIIEQKKTEISELAGKIIFGVRKAVRQLVETSASNNEELIVGDKDGGFKSVPAKELLKTLPKT